MTISSRKHEVNIHSYSSTPSFLRNLTQPEIIDDYDVISNDEDNDNIINDLDLAEGLKDMLVSHGFNLELLLNIRPYDLAEMFGIDEYVAKIIIGTAYNIEEKKS